MCLFENEIEALLVATGKAADIAHVMVADTEHQIWSEPSTARAIRSQLDKDYEIYSNLMGCVSTSLSAVKLELRAFDHLEQQKAKVKSMTHMCRRSSLTNDRTRELEKRYCAYVQLQRLQSTAPRTKSKSRP